MKMTIKEISKTAVIRISGKIDPLSRDSGFGTFEFSSTLTADVSLEKGSLADASAKLYQAAWDAATADWNKAMGDSELCKAVSSNALEDLRRSKIREENRAKQREQ